jgi:hypothetical protein
MMEVVPVEPAVKVPAACAPELAVLKLKVTPQSSWREETGCFC